MVGHTEPSSANCFFGVRERAVRKPATEEGLNPLILPEAVHAGANGQKTKGPLTSGDHRDPLLDHRTPIRVNIAAHARATANSNEPIVFGILAPETMLIARAQR